LQENYLKTQPARVRNLDGPEKTLKELQLMERAAASISDGDLIDGLIHGFVVDQFSVPTVITID
jgi:replication factor C subunit 1